MALRRTSPLKYSPKGLSDTMDATEDFPGAMSNLQNLIPDPTTLDIWQCRPAASQLTDFTGFNTPTFISATKVVGSKVYGMIASAKTPGYDEPFCWDIIGGAFIAITGVTGVNVPATQSSSGQWTPPIMEIIGTKIMVCHPGFNVAGGLYLGAIDISNTSAPTWFAGNTTPTALVSLPVSVAQFGNRAWYLCNPAVGNPAAYFSDVLTPLTITNGTQILTFGDNIPLTHAAGLPANSQLTGTVTQALIIFKGVSGMYQVTGDAATNDLAANQLPVATGTLAPLSVAQTPKGLAFMAPDGYRMIDFNTQVSDPIGVAGSGVTVPFSYISEPSRAAAAFSNGVLRASVQNGYAAGAPQQEYWCHFSRNMIWSGPHTLPASSIQPYKNTFIEAAQGVNAKLFQSDVAQSSLSGFVENGVQLSWVEQTAYLPDPGQMAEMELTETTLNIGFVASLPDITITCIDESGAILDTVTISVPTGATVWGGFTWGAANWGAAASPYTPRQVAWTTPIVFRRLYLTAQGQSAANVRIGNWFLRYRILRYLQQ